MRSTSVVGSVMSCSAARSATVCGRSVPSTWQCSSTFGSRRRYSAYSISDSSHGDDDQARDDTRDDAATLPFVERRGCDAESRDGAHRDQRRLHAYEMSTRLRLHSREISSRLGSD